MTERRSGVGIILLLLGLGAVAAMIYLKITREAGEEITIENIEKKEGISVAVERPVIRSFAEYVLCDGTVDAVNRHLLCANIGEVVERVNVEVGDRVRSDQLLLEFRKKDLEARVAAAKAAYDEAKMNYERYQILFDKGGVPENSVEARRTAYEASLAVLMQAESQLAFAEVRCPAGGDIRVEKRYVEPGEQKGVGKELLMLVDLSKLEIMVSVPESVAVELRSGAVAEYRSAETDEWFRGRIDRVSPATSHPNRFFNAFIPVGTAEDRPQGILPGMYVDVRLVRNESEGCIAVSSGAVRKKDGREYLYVVQNDSTARRVAVRTGLRSEGYLQILGQDVQTASVVISNPRDDIEDGSLVRVSATR